MMGQATSYYEGSTSLKPLRGDCTRKHKEDPEHHCYYWKCAVALGVVLAIVSSAFVVTVSAVLLLMRPSDALVSHAVPSLAPPFASSPASLFVSYCPKKWVGYGGKCYYFSEEEKSWNASQHFCSSFNASLAGIDTLQEKDFIMRYAGLVEHWIGLRRESGQPWKWVNGTQLKQQLFEVRAEGDCAYLSDVFVSSSRCYSVRNWICSKPDAYMKAKKNVMEGE
ncbi:C-type lectin domain family 2 member D-like [Pelodiscus sinensis]|uniref:C-type lectin domain family 2 member D-like n=1 Tax=Pelodiscus sinensis TaxID=13735 RepID=UPI003F6B2F38